MRVNILKCNLVRPLISSTPIFFPFDFPLKAEVIRETHESTRSCSGQFTPCISVFPLVHPFAWFACLLIMQDLLSYTSLGFSHVSAFWRKLLFILCRTTATTLPCFRVFPYMFRFHHHQQHKISFVYMLCYSWG